ncbi:MAG: type II secretion system protein [Phycisphaeraceae bacterium]|nr:type II secretion system protein [Phycisphaeraceae bacterium]MCW5755405.1 type II secretion system protein [Phycisphaeraceae bacterium]
MTLPHDHPRSLASPVAATRRRAFTLIELIVVMAIIATIMSILLPSIAGARESARRLKCMTNLKGFGMAFSIYLKERGEILPYVRPLQEPPRPGSPNTPDMLDVLSEYIDVAPPRKPEFGEYYEYVGAPWACPSDITGRDESTEFQPVWATAGTSYYYLPGGLMMFFEATLAIPADRVAAHVTRLYERQNNAGVVMLDADPWHAPRRQDNRGHNALYFNDWRVEEMDSGSTRAPQFP